MSAEAQVCQACGLCCDGSLFARVPLTAEDRAPSALTVDTKPNGARSIRQRCTALSGTCCTVYEERPTACRGYTCLLYEAVRSGEETLTGAVGIVAKAKVLTAAVQPSLTEARVAASKEDARPDPALEKAEAWLQFHFLGHRRA